MDTRITATVAQVFNLLVSKQFSLAEEWTQGVRLSAQEMCDAINQYGRTLITGPAEQLQKMNIVEIAGALPKRWSVQVPFWTKEEGRSDLSLELTLIDCDIDLSVEIDDIHVL